MSRYREILNRLDALIDEGEKDETRHQLVAARECVERAAGMEPCPNCGKPLEPREFVDITTDGEEEEMVCEGCAKAILARRWSAAILAHRLSTP